MPEHKHYLKISLYSLIILTVIVFTASFALAGDGTGVYEIAVGSSKIINISEPIKRVAIGNPTIAEYTPYSKNELVIIGTKAGRTELSIWTDTDFKTFILKVYDNVVEIQGKITEIMGPNVAKMVSVHVAKETAVLKGLVSSSYECEQIEKIAMLYYPRVLNLIEVKDVIAAKAAEEKKQAQPVLDSYKLSSPTFQAALAPEQPSQPAQIAAAMQYPQNTVIRDKDIMEIKAIEKYKENKNSYGAGVVSYNEMIYVPGFEMKREDYEKAGDKTTKIIPLQNAVATDIESALIKIKSADGTIIKDDRTNSLIIMDRPGVVEKMENLVKILDIPQPQVLIEAKIIEVSLNDQISNTLDWIYETLGQTVSNNKTISFKEGQLGIGLDYGKINSEHFSAAILPSLINRHARLLSSPSTVTLNKQKAIFNVQEKHPYFTAGTTPNPNGGAPIVSPTTTEFANSGISLTVTPTINQEENIRLDLSISITSYLGEVKSGTNVAPLTNLRTTQNIVEVKNGEMLIISGLIDTLASKDANKVPFFYKIPFIGTLFKSDTSKNTRSELLIFITPKIVGKDSRFAKINKERYTKIAENSPPCVDEKFKISDLLGDKDRTNNEKITATPGAQASITGNALQETPKAASAKIDKKENIISFNFEDSQERLAKTKKLIKGESPKNRIYLPETLKAKANGNTAKLEEEFEEDETEVELAPAELFMTAKETTRPVQNCVAEEHKAPAAREERLIESCMAAAPADATSLRSKYRSDKANELIERLRSNMSRHSK